MTYDQENDDRRPLLPLPITTSSSSSSSSSSSHPAPPPQLSPTRTSRLFPPKSEKARGKQRALSTTSQQSPTIPTSTTTADQAEEEQSPRSKGRHVTVVFSNVDDAGGGGNLEVWVEDGESVASVKDQIRHLRPPLATSTLRLIHSGRLLTDGILLVPWLRSLEERVRRQAQGVGGEVESVLKDVGLGEDEDDGDHLGKTGSGEGAEGEKKGRGGGAERVWLHCVVGGQIGSPKTPAGEVDEPSASGPRRRGFDVLLDAGLSAEDVAHMRRQFYESRGEEVPEGMDLGDVNDEHARALEEQWIEGDLTAETAETSTEGMYASILHGLLAGFLFPLVPWLFFREPPLPNFFDAEAEADESEGLRGVSERVAESPRVGGEWVQGVAFGKRMQMGILLGTILNLAFGMLRFLN